MELMQEVYNSTTVVCMRETKKPSPWVDVEKTEYSLMIVTHQQLRLSLLNPIRASQLSQSLSSISHPMGNIPAVCKKQTLNLPVCKV